MTMLDVMASRVVYAARVFERAVHDPGPWFIEYQGVRFPAMRVCEQDRVTFTADLPIQETGFITVGLHCGDELLSVRELTVEQVFEDGLAIDWAVELTTVA